MRYKEIQSEERKKRKVQSSPFIGPEGVTVEVRAIDEEACSLDHIFRYHAETIQDVAQLTKGEISGKILFIFLQ